MGVDQWGDGLSGGDAFPPLFRAGGDSIGNVPPTFLPIKHEAHLGLAIVHLLTLFLSLLLFWLKLCLARGAPPRTPVEGLQRPQTPAVTRCLRKLFDVSLQCPPPHTFYHRSMPLYNSTPVDRFTTNSLRPTTTSLILYFGGDTASLMANLNKLFSHLNSRQGQGQARGRGVQLSLSPQAGAFFFT